MKFLASVVGYFASSSSRTGPLAHRRLRKTAVCTLSACAVIFLSLAAVGQTFTVTASPSLTIYPGEQNLPLSVTVANSTYTGPITVTLTGLPSGITVTPLTLPGSGTGNLILNASVSAGTEGFYNGYNASWTATVTVVAAAGSTQASTQLPLTVSVSNPSFAPAASAINLPIVTINTSGVAILSKTTDVPGSITITSADGQTSYLPNATDSDNTATFHVHGNSTSLFPKLPYEIHLNTSLDLLGTMGLVCPYVTSKGAATCDKSKTYILLANYDDKTLLRDWSASALANAIPIGNGYLSSPKGSPTPSGTKTLLPWAPHSLFVELYLNGVYEGNYQLIEKVNVDSHRINITELAETDVTDDITGGYLLEIDERQDEAFVFTTPQGVQLGLIDPDFTPDPEVPEQTSYISNYVDTAEAALFSSNFTSPTLGWRAYFDEASAVNFYIVNDLMGNVDGGVFYSSDYLYKAIDNPLLYMGPIWDFDISSGNVNYAPIVNPTVPWMQQNATWYIRWFKDPGFQADVVTQWNALKNNGVFSAWLASIPKQAQTLEQSQLNNFGRWPMQGVEVWPNSEAVGSYDGEVQYLTTWLQLRFAYLDSLFNNKAQTATTLTVGAGPLRTGTPVLLTAQVTGGTSPSGVVSFLYNNILLGTGTLSNGTATLTTSTLPAGAYQIQAVYNGDTTNGLSASTPQSVTVAAALVATNVSVAGPSSASFGASTSFTAAVIPNSGSGVPTGTVSFSVDNAAGTSETMDGTGAASFSTSALTAGTHTVTAVYSGDTNYGTASSTTLPVQVATATPAIVWATPAAITYGTPLGPAQLDASSTVAGTFAYSPAAETVLTPGMQTLNVIFTPTDTTDYTTASASVTLTVNPAAQVPASAANSTVVVAPSPAVAGNSSTVTVTLEDAGGNAINGATAAFTSTSSTVSFGTPAVSGNVITATITDTVAETAPISITLGGTASGTLTGSEPFVAPGYLVSVNTDPSTGSGTPSNCVDPNLPSYSVAANAGCQLRDAIAAANALTGVTTNISFGLPNPSTILIGQATGITISQNVNINGPSASSVTIEGGTSPLKGVTQTPNFRILQISSGNVSVANLTLANSDVFTGGGYGSAINDYGSGTLSVTNCTFVANFSTEGGNSSGGGGAIQVAGNLTVTNSTFDGGITTGQGGAIYITPGTLTVTNSTFNANSSQIAGGAIYAPAGGTVGNSIFRDDYAPSGSGIYTTGSLTLTNSVNDGDTFAGVTQTNVVAASANLSALGNYGGSTQTFVPLPGSAAICQGSTANITPSITTNQSFTDQRGATHSTAYCTSTQLDAGAVQTSYSLAFTTQPTETTIPNAIAPAPVVQVEENGVAQAVSGVAIGLTDAGSVENSGTCAATGSTGASSCTNVGFSGASANDTLTASASLLVSGLTAATSTPLVATSSTFNVLAAGTVLPPTISASFNPVQIALNANTSASFSINNPNSGVALSGVAFTDTLPDGLVVASIPGVGNSCGGTVTATPGSSSIAFTGGALDASVTCAIGVYVTGTATGVKSNTTGVISATNQTTIGTTSNTASVTVTSLGSLTVTGFPASSATGVAQNVTVTAYDTTNALMTGFTGTVLLTSSDPSATLPLAYTFTPTDAGVHVFPVTLNTAGTQSITATSGLISGSDSSLISTGFIVVLSPAGDLSKFLANGTAASPPSGYTGGGIPTAGLAADAAGDIFSVNAASNVLTEFSNLGAPLSDTGYTGGGLSSPAQVAVDGRGQVWVTNATGSVSLFSNAGVALSPATGYTGAGTYSTPFGITIDVAGNVWVANSGNNTVTEILGAAAPAAPPATAITNGTMGARP